MSENEMALTGDSLDVFGETRVLQEENDTALATPASSPVLAIIPEKAQGLMARMFADPYLLEKTERTDLAAQLRACVAKNPRVSELRVLLGMALCVNFEVPDAIEELREGVRLSPDSFIANLKLGELWMRLRVMDKAEQHTHHAALFATSRAQSELARRQAASIRSMKHAGIERGGYTSPWLALTRLARRVWKRRPSESEEALPALDAN